MKKQTKKTTVVSVVGEWHNKIKCKRKIPCYESHIYYSHLLPSFPYATILLSQPAATIDEPQHRAYGEQECLHNWPYKNQTKGEWKKQGWLLDWLLSYTVL